jgi:hypothetical protein
MSPYPYRRNVLSSTDPPRFCEAFRGAIALFWMNK